MKYRAKRSAHGAYKKRPSFSQLCQKQRDTRNEDHAAVLEDQRNAKTEHPRTFPRSEQNNLWKTTALAPDQRLRRGRSTKQQCWRDHRQAMTLQEHTKRRSRTRSSAKVTRGGRWRLGKEEANVRGSHARAETNETGNKYQDIRSALRRIKRAVPTAGRKEQCQEQADKKPKERTYSW